MNNSKEFERAKTKYNIKKASGLANEQDILNLITASVDEFDIASETIHLDNLANSFYGKYQFGDGFYFKTISVLNSLLKEAIILDTEEFLALTCAVASDLSKEFFNELSKASTEDILDKYKGFSMVEYVFNNNDEDREFEKVVELIKDGINAISQKDVNTLSFIISSLCFA